MSKMTFLLLGILIALLATLEQHRPAHPATLTSPNSENGTVAIDLWRDFPGEEPSGIGRGAADLVRPGNLFTDHIFVRNDTAKWTPRITVEAYWQSPVLRYLDWSGTGANADAWTLETLDNSTYRAIFAPEAGIEPGGVGEMTISFVVKDTNQWPTQGTLDATHQATAYVEQNDVLAHQTSDTLTSPIKPVALARKEGVTIRTNVVRENQLVVWKAEKGGVQPLLTANMVFPYVRYEYSLGTMVASAIHNGQVRREACETQVRTDQAAALVTLRLGDCISRPDSRYAYLTRGGVGALLKATTPADAQLFETGGGRNWKTYAGSKNNLIIQVVEGVELQVPPLQGIQVTYPNPAAPEKREVVQLYRDWDSWRILTFPSPVLPYSKADYFSQLVIHQNGTATFNQFFFWGLSHT